MGEMNLLQAGEENGVDLRVFGDALIEFHSVGISVGKGHRRTIGLIIVLSALQHQSWESHERQCDWARSSNDEHRRQTVDFVEVQRRIKRIREWRLFQRCADIRTMAGFDGEDSAGGSKVIFIHDGGCSSKISRDTDAFEYTGESDEGVDVCGGELVL